MTRKKKGGLVNIAKGGGVDKSVLPGVALLETLAGYEGLSTVQAARLIGCSPKTLENWRWRGIGPAYRKLGAKKVTYSATTIRAYLADYHCAL